MKMKNLVSAVFSAFLLFACSSADEPNISNSHPKDIQVVCPLLSDISDDGLSDVYVYENGQLVSYINSYSPGSYFITDYSYNDRGLLIRATEQKQYGEIIDFEYDQADRLTRVKMKSNDQTSSMRVGKGISLSDLMWKIRSKRIKATMEGEYFLIYEFRYQGANFLPSEVVGFIDGEEMMGRLKFEYKGGNATRVFSEDEDGGTYEMLFEFDDKPLKEASLPFPLRFMYFVISENNFTHIEERIDGVVSVESDYRYQYDDNGLVLTTDLNFKELDNDGQVFNSGTVYIQSTYLCE